MSKFDGGANLLAANFGSGFNLHPESCVVDAANNVYAGQAEIQNDDVRIDFSGERDGIHPGVGHTDLEFLSLEVAGDHAGQSSLVIDHQSPIAHDAAGSPIRHGLHGLHRAAAFLFGVVVGPVFSESSQNSYRFIGI